MTYQVNPILNTDSYKVSMFKQYPPGTTKVYSYIESRRGGRYDHTVFFGLQMYVKEYMLQPVTREHIEEAESILVPHGEPFNRKGWEDLVNKHGGYKPLRVRAVPEGLRVPTGNVLVTIENTDPDFHWLTTYEETPLLRGVWYPTTVATVSRAIKEVILDFLEKTGDPGLIDFKLHDFGARGVSSWESGGIGDAAHLVNFKGTDTLTGIVFARNYYGADMPGFSIPAAEHSTITSWGRDNEAKAYDNMLNQFAKPGAVLAVVSDSYDIYHAAAKIWGEELRQKVIDSGAVLVIRPDSGDPVEVNRRVIEILGEKFGYTVNSKGFKVLNYVRLIQGDGVNLLSIRSILGALMAMGWSADNIGFGMGGALLQGVDRDLERFAMKCSSVEVDGGLVDVQKDPITDPGKKSKAGRVTLWRNSSGEYVSAVEQPKGWTDKGTGPFYDALEDVYLNGKLMREHSFDEVRENSNR